MTATSRAPTSHHPGAVRLSRVDPGGEHNVGPVPQGRDFEVAARPAGDRQEVAAVARQRPAQQLPLQPLLPAGRQLQAEQVQLQVGIRKGKVVGDVVHLILGEGDGEGQRVVVARVAALGLARGPRVGVFVVGRALTEPAPAAKAGRVHDWEHAVLELRAGLLQVDNVKLVLAPRLDALEAKVEPLVVSRGVDVRIEREREGVLVRLP